jgi:hypothetical protein
VDGYLQNVAMSGWGASVGTGSLMGMMALFDGIYVVFEDALVIGQPYQSVANN